MVRRTRLWLCHLGACPIRDRRSPRQWEIEWAMGIRRWQEGQSFHLKTSHLHSSPVALCERRPENAVQHPEKPTENWPHEHPVAGITVRETSLFFGRLCVCVSCLNVWVKRRFIFTTVIAEKQSEQSVFLSPSFRWYLSKTRLQWPS